MDTLDFPSACDKVEKILNEWMQTRLDLIQQEKLYAEAKLRLGTAKATAYREATGTAKERDAEVALMTADIEQSVIQIRENRDRTQQLADAYYRRYQVAFQELQFWLSELETDDEV